MNDTQSVRIGDAERNTATAALGEHYAAGRLTKEEYDERTEQVWSARYGADLGPIFADLPKTPEAPTPRAAQRPARAGGPQCVGAGGPGGMLPLLVIGGLITLAVFGAPWLLVIAFVVWMTGGLGFRRMHRRNRVAVARFHGERF